jgi:hypothetical protein
MITNSSSANILSPTLRRRPSSNNLLEELKRCKIIGGLSHYTGGGIRNPYLTTDAMNVVQETEGTPFLFIVSNMFLTVSNSEG